MIKLINERTKEIVVFGDGIIDLSKIGCKNVAEMIDAGWKDYKEEPKRSALDLMIPTLTNFIEKEPDEDKVDLEDCKQMLERLKVWKRLEENGFRFDGWKRNGRYCGDFTITASDSMYCDDKDLDLLFGGKDEKEE